MTTLEQFREVHRDTCHGHCPMCWVLDKIDAALAALDYDLRDVPDRECDRRLWTANMTARAILRGRQ